MSLLYTIGYVGSALAPVLSPSGLWSKPSAGSNKVRIWAGLSRDNDQQRSTGGDAPDIVLWDSNGTFINYDLAKTWAGYRAHIGNGKFRDYSVPNENGRKAGSAEYISVIAGGDDGLCLTAVTVRTSEADGLTWTGDIGYACGLPWYAQEATISKSNHRPKCVWLDDNHTPGSHKWKGMSVHLPSFTIEGQQNAENLAESWKSNNDLVCQSEARWSMYEKIEIPFRIQVFDQKLQRNSDGTDDDQQILNEANWKRAEEPSDALGTCAPKSEQLKGSPQEKGCWPQKPSAQDRLQRQTETKRSLGERQAAMSDEVVISSLKGNDVFDLCNSDTSLGPDFASLPNNMFCDMSTKTLWPLCGDPATEDCFDVDEKEMKWASGELKKRDGSEAKVYRRVRTWGS